MIRCEENEIRLKEMRLRVPRYAICMTLRSKTITCTLPPATMPTYRRPLQQMWHLHMICVWLPTRSSTATPVPAFRRQLKGRITSAHIMRVYATECRHMRPRALCLTSRARNISKVRYPRPDQACSGVCCWISRHCNYQTQPFQWRWQRNCIIKIIDKNILRWCHHNACKVLVCAFKF